MDPAQNQCNDPAAPRFKNYIGAKIIQAMPMSENEFLKTVKGRDIGDLATDRLGYCVTYPPAVEGDAPYQSWSPKAVFEIAYREITGAELRLIGGA